LVRGGGVVVVFCVEAAGLSAVALVEGDLRGQSRRSRSSVVVVVVVDVGGVG